MNRKEAFLITFLSFIWHCHTALAHETGTQQNPWILNRPEEQTCPTISSGVVDYLFTVLQTSLNNVKCHIGRSELWPKDYGENVFDGNLPDFDYVVIGAGSSGSVVASRLSENPNVNVLVLEAGGDPPIESEIHSVSLSLSGTQYTWSDYGVYNKNFCQAMRSGRCYWPRGKMLGGTGALNGNVFLPGRPTDFDEWYLAGNPGWSWREISRYYQYALNNSLDEKTFPRGHLVLNNFQRPNYYAQLVNLMADASASLRESYKCSKSNEYYPFVLGTIDRGIRMSTGKTYLGKVSPYRKNLKVIKHALVTEILIDEKHTVRGVKFLLRNSKILTVNVRSEVILSAGAFGSPKILMLSGIGPSQQLQYVNIKPRYNLPVGNGLQDHGLLTLILKFTKNLPQIPSNNEFANSQNIYDYFMHQTGLLSINPTLIGLVDTNFWHCYKSFEQKANVMIVSQLVKPTRNSNVFSFLKMREDIVESFLSQVENQPMLELHGLLAKPKSRGYVRLNSSNPHDSLLIYNSYASHPEDAQGFLSYIRYVQKLTRTPQFQYFGLQLVHIPLPSCFQYLFDSDEYWLCYMRHFLLSSWHAASTVRMGPSKDSTSVVDYRLKVHGIQGLRVVDASIMPNITSYNTNTPSIIIAERAADFIKADQKLHW